MNMSLGKSIFLFAITLLLGVHCAYSQLLSVETIIDTNVLVIGDQTGLTYTLQKDSRVLVKLPIELTNFGENVEVVGQPNVDTSLSDKASGIIKLSYIITSFDTGTHFIPPIPFVVNMKGMVDTIFSESVYFEVVGVPIDTTGTIRDIKANAKAPVTFKELLLYILIVLVLVLIGWFIYKYLRNKKIEQGIIEPVKVTEPAYITALRELDKIKAQKLWQQKHVKAYYVGITHTIRWYISKRFNFPALEETSDQILDQLGFLNLDRENYDKLTNLLNLADLVKFAKGEPNPDENIIHLDNAYDFIKKTKDQVENSTQGPTEVKNHIE